MIREFNFRTRFDKNIKRLDAASIIQLYLLLPY